MRPVLLVLALITTGVGCSSPTDPTTMPAGTVQIVGSVQYFTLEGGFWAVRGDDGKTYDPMNGLPSDYHIENLRVSVTAKMRDDVGGIHMVGPIVEIISIQRT